MLTGWPRSTLAGCEMRDSVQLGPTVLAMPAGFSKMAGLAANPPPVKPRFAPTMKAEAPDDAQPGLVDVLVELACVLDESRVCARWQKSLEWTVASLQQKWSTTMLSAAEDQAEETASGGQAQLQRILRTRYEFL